MEVANLPVATVINVLSLKNSETWKDSNLYLQVWWAHIKTLLCKLSNKKWNRLSVNYRQLSSIIVFDVKKRHSDGISLFTRVQDRVNYKLFIKLLRAKMW